MHIFFSERKHLAVSPPIDLHLIFEKLSLSILNLNFADYLGSKNQVCRGNYSFLNSSSEETIQGEETIQWRKLYEEIRYAYYDI